jgi:RHS repeat-associated protein
MVTNTSYNTAGLPTGITYGSGDSDSFIYDPNTNRMTQYKFTVGTSPQSLTGNLTWNANGTLLTQNITDAFNAANTQNCSYSYDDLSRLSNANCGSAAAQTFTYDPFGNINKSGSPYSFQPSYSSSTNRMSSIGSFTPTYDGAGNVTNDSLHTYTWDVYGRPSTVDSVNVTYDALGRMVEQNRSGAYTQLVYSPTGQKMQIMNGQASAKSIVVLPGGGQAVFSATGLLYYGHPDHLGSSRFASTPSRTMYFDTAYAPFGEPYATSGTPDPSFTGQRQDTVAGLYDFLAREYSYQGRWSSPDPVGRKAVSPSKPQTWNRYAYVTNNPLALVDPLGLKPYLYQCGSDGTGCGGNGGGGYGGIVWGNDIFDAIAGAPGTYVSADMYGNLSFGFSVPLYSLTFNEIDAIRQSVENPNSTVPPHDITDAGPYPFSGFQVYTKDWGTYTETSGIIPDYLQALGTVSYLTAQARPYMPPHEIGDMPTSLQNALEAAVNRFASIQLQLIQLVLGNAGANW